MRKLLAIKGHETRGKEVIEILKMLGASNKSNYTGSYSTTIYILNDNDNDIIISYDCDYNNLEIFKLEDFLKKYPFKIGDKVINDNYSGYGIITTMVWNSVDWCVKYRVEFEDFGTIKWFKSNEIKISDIRCHTDCTLYTDPLHELCESKTSTLIINSEVCKDEVEIVLNDYEIEVRDGKTFAVKKKPKYPTTYRECCKVLDTDCTAISRPGYEYRKIAFFQQLLICRDAYWKIAGDEMGLDKSWEPDWTDNYEKKYIINFYQNEINFTNGTNAQYILSFPTKEMRDMFYENFKDIIEKCKELL